MPVFLGSPKKIFVHLVDNEYFGMVFLSGAFEEHGFSSYLFNFLRVS
jgi:hypothetical protein